MRDKVRTLFAAVILSGVIVLGIGLYYVLVKAGLPYQDAPTDLAIEWMADQRAGETLSQTGALVLGIGVLGQILLYLSKRKKKETA